MALSWTGSSPRALTWDNSASSGGEKGAGSGWRPVPAEGLAPGPSPVPPHGCLPCGSASWHPHDFAFLGGYCAYRLQWLRVTLLSTRESHSLPLTGGRRAGLVTFGAGAVSLGLGFGEVRLIPSPPPHSPSAALQLFHRELAVLPDSRPAGSLSL